VLTIAGTRPELIRLSLIIKRLDERFDHAFVWTGQNYTRELKDIFFEKLNIREPDFSLRGGPSSLAAQLGRTFEVTEGAIGAHRPDVALVLGDTNSALSTIICERMGVPVIHMEAGNRCFDLRVPEEINRRVIDHAATWNLPYTRGSRQNLIDEGLPKEQIYVCGNPIFEVMRHYAPHIKYRGRPAEEYMLATFHRQENVDSREPLTEIAEALKALSERMPVMCSIHPRTKQKLEKYEIGFEGTRVELFDPIDFVAFLELERCASLVLTDSGTVQEECCILGVPTVTIRNTTERPETVDCGSNFVSGVERGRIFACANEMLDIPRVWSVPAEYIDPIVSLKVADFVEAVTS
jgi:UDP-N-acetylglucosamine 2-epimerase (non-hydrolysing)